MDTTRLHPGDELVETRPEFGERPDAPGSRREKQLRRVLGLAG